MKCLSLCLVLAFAGAVSAGDVGQKQNIVQDVPGTVTSGAGHCDDVQNVVVEKVIVRRYVAPPVQRVIVEQPAYIQRVIVRENVIVQRQNAYGYGNVQNVIVQRQNAYGYGGRQNIVQSQPRFSGNRFSGQRQRQSAGGGNFANFLDFAFDPQTLLGVGGAAAGVALAGPGAAPAGAALGSFAGQFLGRGLNLGRR